MGTDGSVFCQQRAFAGDRPFPLNVSKHIWTNRTVYTKSGGGLLTPRKSCLALGDSFAHCEVGLRINSHCSPPRQALLAGTVFPLSQHVRASCFTNEQTRTPASPCACTRVLIKSYANLVFLVR